MITCDETLDAVSVETCRQLLKRAAWRIQYKTRMQQVRECNPLYDNQFFDNSFEKMVLSEIYVEELLDVIPWEKCRYIVKRTIIEGISERHVAADLNMTQQGVSKWKKKGLEILKQHLILSIKQ
ncbi:sigma-70 family RNA polymerase sigma factor [Paenibacillus mesotrionivorans]|jgi:DNA-directed RNA polymerase specialized sigma subunit|uniref:Sigma-70 family RNA polymerase sigma factor n=1 Tax=Paenibacillus mesotrionivorans TaxID=3160968 RepID=A0ACC7NSE1_9BACL